jgi:APA family basic amino acid/polyamine antiporter
MVELWVAGGLIALAGALCYSELGAAMPEAGAEYAYLREAYGTFVAYLSGWTSFFLGFSGAIAATALAFAGYLQHFFPGLNPSGISGKCVALALLWLLTGAHAAGVGPGGTLQRILTTATVTGIVAFIAVGFASKHGSTSNFSSAGPAQGSTAVALIFVLYTYSGWNAAAAMSGVLAVAEKAAIGLLGAKAGDLTAGLVGLTLVGSVSAMVLSGPRVYYAMARDGVFFHSIAKVHPTFGTPARAIVLQAIWTSALIVFFGVFEQLVLYTGFAVTVFAALAVASVIVLRVRRAGLERPFRVPVYPLLPAAYVAASGWIAGYTVFSRPSEALIAILTVAAGVPFYFLGRFRDRGSTQPPSQDVPMDGRLVK